ncbi:MAG: type II secretion system GspH family protein [Acidimicrobiia bacterium]|nr:type II secretion system GspH family protein [Acidimicrobiia bacterium]MBT8250382.1 type II secretion system GspH family protein [Acidimicrobiia bacterium]NND13634.1 type II secretion system protein [Acidimicrobiia bacterium]NNL28546.1 type II secretion system protein [Acidimicrobiia bacterium]
MSRQDGFSLVELMIVVLIVAILIAVAVPTFLGQRVTAQDRAAQSALRNGLVAEKSVMAGRFSFTDDVTELQAVEPSFLFVASLSPPVGQIGVAVNGTDVVCMAVQSQSGTWFGIWDAVQDATAFGRSDTAAALFGGSCPLSPPASPAWAGNGW